MDLKLALLLVPQQLKVGHFDKMKVDPARNVLSHDTSAALEFLAEELGEGLSERYTTAWFVRQISKWYDLMTSRTPHLALSKFKLVEYKENITFLEEIIALFRSLQIVQKNGRTFWKPIQTGVILSTTSILNLQEQLFQEGFKYILTSRFSQDAVENLFGVVRSKQVIPSALQFKQNLKLIAVSQYLRKCRNGSYEVDDTENIPGFFFKW
ncbi:hypothetical protein JTE90_027105 [Oedothorax gibbosus]|uniref:Transposable element P transposase-like GTP-binding insertion domain-containing protein n=1 Tax=Oedothorax gibbosus TaxID=931172 RepID=A0AAV6TR17_9ARAC|nr:hypothetical protein JTE90_027105 [Oedothorax gibbosus]